MQVASRLELLAGLRPSGPRWSVEVPRLLWVRASSSWYSGTEGRRAQLLLQVVGRSILRRGPRHVGPIPGQQEPKVVVGMSQILLVKRHGRESDDQFLL